MSRKRHSLFILKDMLIFEELLESYSQLRKRRYSFSDSLLVEGQTNTAWNSALGPVMLVGQRGDKVDQNMYIQALTSLKSNLERQLGQQVELPRTGKKTITGLADDFVTDIKARIAIAQQKSEGSQDHEQGVSDQTGGGFSMPSRLADEMPETVALFDSATRKLSLLAGEDMQEDLEAELNDLRDRIFGEAESTNTTLAKVINAFAEGNFDLSKDAIQEFTDDLNMLSDLLSGFKESGEKCFEIENEGQRQVLNRFFLRKGGNRVHYGTNDGSTPPLMMEGFKHVNTKKSEKDFVGISNRDRAYGISVGTEGGLLKHVFQKFSGPEATICGELDSKGNRKRIIEPAKTAGQGYYTARSQLAEVSDLLGDDINRLRADPSNKILKSKILKTLAITVKASERHIDAFRNTVITLDQHKLPLVPEHFTAESLAREFSELESDFSTPSIEIALKLVSREIALSQNSRLSKVLKARGNVNGRSQELAGVGSIEKTTGFQNIPGSNLSKDVVKGDSVVQCSRDEKVGICTDLGSNLSPDSIRYQGMEPLEISSKAKSSNKELSDGTSDVGTRKIDGPDVDWDSSEQITEIHIQALEEQGMDKRMSERIRKVESRERREVSYVNSCFENIRPEVKKNADDNIESLKADAKNLPALVDRLRLLSRNAKGQDALSFESHIKFLEDFSQDPEGLMKSSGVKTQKQLMGHAMARATTCFTVLAIPEKDRIAKHIRDVANIGCSTSEMVISMESFGRERIDVLQSQLIDEGLVKLANGEYSLRTTPSGALASYKTYESEEGVTKERTCFTSSTRENNGMRTGVTISGAHVAAVASSLEN